MYSKLIRIFYAFYLLRFRSVFSNKQFISPKSWCYWVESAPWKLFIMMSSEISYPKFMFRLMYRKNMKSYWINNSSSINKNNKNISNLWNEILKKNNTDYILILSDGDVCIDINKNTVLKRISEHEFCKRIYCQNLLDVQSRVLHNEKIKPIPIGFDFHTIRNGESPASLMKFILEFTKQKKLITEDSYLIDFKGSNSSNLRPLIIANLYDNENVTILEKRLSQKDIWKLYQQFYGVISPPGGGLDCHRTWEALYFGCVVYIYTSRMNELYKGIRNIYQIDDIDNISQCLNYNWTAIQRDLQCVSFNKFILKEDRAYFN